MDVCGRRGLALIARLWGCALIGVTPQPPAELHDLMCVLRVPGEQQDAEQEQAERRAWSSGSATRSGVMMRRDIAPALMGVPAESAVTSPEIGEDASRTEQVSGPTMRVKLQSSARCDACILLHFTRSRIGSAWP